MLGIVTVDDAIDAIMPDDIAKKLPRFGAHHHRPFTGAVKPEELVEFAEALARITASGGGPKALAAHLARIAHGGVHAGRRALASARDRRAAAPCRRARATSQ